MLTSKTFRQLKQAGAIKLLVTLHDVSMAGLAVVFAFILRLDGDMALLQEHRAAMMLTALIAMFVGSFAYRFYGSHKGMWRYASVPDFLTIIRCSIWVSGSLALFSFLARDLVVLPRSIPFLVLVLLPTLLGSSRLLYRGVRDYRLARENAHEFDDEQTQVLIIGESSGARNFVRSTIEAGHNPYRVVGFVSKETVHVGSEVLGVPILSTIADYRNAISNLTQHPSANKHVIFSNEVFLSHSSLVGEIMDTAKELGIPVSRLPNSNFFEKGQGSLGATTLRSVSLEDVLGRRQRILDTKAESHQFAGQTIMITGGGGSIGSELARQVGSMTISRLVIVDNCEFNLYTVEQDLLSMGVSCEIDLQLASVRNRKRIFDLVEQVRPDGIFHAAALKHVPLMERNPLEAVLTNLYGTMNMVDAAGAFGVRNFLLVSTDKAVNPSSVMGTTKRLAENVLLQASEQYPNTQFNAVRFGNVLGSSGSVIPAFKKQIEQGGPITVTHKEMTRYFMTLPEAVSLILKAYLAGQGGPGKPAQIFVLDMGEPVKIDSLARQMIRLTGYLPDKDIQVIYTGVRPGEKLYEELFYNKEQLDVTEVKGVFLARGFNPLQINVDQLVESSLNNERLKVQDMIQAIRLQFVEGNDNQSGFLETGISGDVELGLGASLKK